MLSVPSTGVETTCIMVPAAGGAGLPVVTIVPSASLGNFNVRLDVGLLSGAVIETLLPPECTNFMLLTVLSP